MESETRFEISELWVGSIGAIIATISMTPEWNTQTQQDQPNANGDDVLSLYLSNILC